MLNRMVYLSEESANGVYDNDVDRAALQDEVSALQTEINRIADSANFNGKKLFAADVNISTVDFTFQIGDTANDYDQLNMNDIITDGADLKTLLTDALGIDISTVDGAKTAITTLKDNTADAAINKISTLRAKLGATQNRLDHTGNNLSVMAENITDAESGIRDTDVAEEMMSYTKNNILIQSAQAMLAQSNAVPQGVLQLLQ